MLDIDKGNALKVSHSRLLRDIACGASSTP